MIAAEVWINHTRPAYARLPRNGLRFRFVMRHVLKTREVTSIFRKAGKVVNVEKRRIYWSFLPHYYIYSTHLRHMRNVLILFFALTSACNLQGQALPGKPAPVIAVDKWVRNPNYPFKKPEGKVVVLDFWFINCGPCIYTIPHLNELSRQYRDEDVIFLAVTFDRPEAVSNFLKKKVMLANVGTDTSRQLISKFGVLGFPTTFVIDRMGITRWTGHPQQLDSDKLDLVLGKKYFPKLVPDSYGTIPATTHDPNENNSTFQVDLNINDYMAPGASGSQITSLAVGYVNRTLNQILSDMLNTSSNRILSADSNRYDISCKLPRDYPREQIGETFVRSVLQELDYELRSVKTQVAGYRLTVSNDSLLNQHAVNPNANSHTNATEVRWGIWTGKGHQFSELIRELESRFNVYIQDGTEINGFFKFQFPIKDFQTATEYLLEKYGLTFVSQDLEIDLRVISSR